MTHCRKIVLLQHAKKAKTYHKYILISLTVESQQYTDKVQHLKIRSMSLSQRSIH